VVPKATCEKTKLPDASPRPLPCVSSMAYDMPEANAKISWSTCTLKRNSDTRGLWDFPLIADLKALGLMKCVLK